MRRLIQKLWKRTEGAVAPTVALSMVGLLAAGGMAFDYARLATMDTELQQAADQAALAAATQLDRSDDSTSRAAASIQNPTATNRLAANFTRFANDEEGAPVVIENVIFCSAFDDSIASTDAACTETTDDEEARFVIVRTSLRTANYAFTPVVEAISGTSRAEAVAGVESSICNVAPLLVCVGDTNFPTAEDIGRGVIMKTAGGNSWAPGNYGYLDFGNGNQAVLDGLLGHGLNGCQATDDNETEPGNKNATDAINTRMDVYGGTGATNSPSACTADGTGCPAKNTRKDMTLEMTWEIKQKTNLGKPTPPSCGAAATAKNANPMVTYASGFALNQAGKGFPRDSCHYAGTCNDGNFGDADWGRDAYMTANHPGVSLSSVAATLGKSVEELTRYDIYVWEQDTTAPGRLDPYQVGATVEATPKVQGQDTTWNFTKQCAFSRPELAKTSYTEQKDRRVLPIVAADCTNLKGKGQAFEDYVILRVFDVFLTEPSMQRSWYSVPTDDKEIYAEVIGPAQTFESGNGFQYYARNKPYLIR